MTQIEQLKCPNCSGLLNAPAGATRVTCPYCGADLAVDLDKQEAMLYALQQQERARDKDRIAEERKQLYQQYMAQYSELRDIDTTLRQRQIIEQTRVVKYQLKELERRRNEVVQGLAALAGKIGAMDRVLNPEMPPTQLPAPAPIPRRRRFNVLLPILGTLFVLIVLGVGYALTLGKMAETDRAGSSVAGQAAPDPTGTALAATRPADTGYFYAKETSHSVTIFAKAYTDRGGVGALGFPITEAFVERDPQDGTARWVQYFEKAVLEYHPELPEGQQFQLARLGALRLHARYPGGTPPESPLAGMNSYKFPETGFKVTDPFLAFWHSSGEVARFGYPLSPSFEEKSDIDGKRYIVQYFERAVMEYHPELNPPYNVQLTPVGIERLKQLYPSGAPMNASTPVPDATK